MNEEKNKVKIIDWTDRKEAMDSYRQFADPDIMGPDLRYYGGKLCPVPLHQVLRPPSVRYTVEGETKMDDEDEYKLIL
jgi:hypothetical protein